MKLYTLFYVFIQTSLPTQTFYYQFLFQAYQVSRFPVVSTPVVPQWIPLLSDWHFLLLLSLSAVMLWSMEGWWKTCSRLLQSFLWSYIADCFQYGAVLAPISIFFRLISIVLILFGLQPNMGLFIPTARDIRFWFDTNFALDLSYLWCPYRH